MIRAGSQLCPPLVDRAIHVGPLSIFSFFSLFSPAEPDRFQTAYTRYGSRGSAVIDSLSSPTVSSVSRARTAGSLHVRPPSSDRLARMAWSASLWLNDRLIACAMPSGPNDTQGSVARS